MFLLYGTTDLIQSQFCFKSMKTQTREHLAICGLLGIPAALAVLTKTDLVSDDLIELARLEVEELLADSPFAGAPVLAASSLDGGGIPRVGVLQRSQSGAHGTRRDRPGQGHENGSRKEYRTRRPDHRDRCGHFLQERVVRRECRRGAPQAFLEGRVEALLQLRDHFMAQHVATRGAIGVGRIVPERNPEESGQFSDLGPGHPQERPQPRIAPGRGDPLGHDLHLRAVSRGLRDHLGRRQSIRRRGR